MLMKRRKILVLQISSGIREAKARSQSSILLIIPSHCPEKGIGPKF